MNDEVNPAANWALHARAERAALAAYLAASDTTGNRRMQLMDRAAARVFLAAGTPRDAAWFYAAAVTSLVLERLHHGSKPGQAPEPDDARPPRHGRSRRAGASPG